MIAVQFSEYGAPDVLQVAEVPAPHAGPGQIRIRVRATGVTPGDVQLRSGAMKDFIPLPLPHISGIDAAGIVDEIGDGVSDVALGDAVFGVVPLHTLGGAAAEFAVLAAWTRKPDALSWEQAGGAAGSVETATRTLDALGVRAGTVLLIEGAAGGVGSVAVQLAVARGAKVVGTASAPNHAFLTSLGATPTTYGPNLIERVTALAPGGVNAALDTAGSGSLPDLITLAGDAGRVITIVDRRSHKYGVVLSRPTGELAAVRTSLDAAAMLAEEGRFTVPIAAVFALNDYAAAHALSETGHARGKIVVTVP